MALNITPLHDRVVVEPSAAEEKTAGGIIIPDSAKEKPQRGTVAAVGAGTKDEPMTVKVGDVVLYGKYAGSEINHEGTEYLVMRESDLIAVINDLTHVGENAQRAIAATFSNQSTDYNKTHTTHGR